MEGGVAAPRQNTALFEFEFKSSVWAISVRVWMADVKEREGATSVAADGKQPLQRDALQNF